jgi:hypothetical protein
MQPLASLVAVLALLATPALAAATTAVPDTTLPAAATDSGADAGDNADSAPPAAAPVPDPFLAEMLQTCRDGASGDPGTFQRLDAAGWGLTVDGDTQTPFYQAFNGEKDYAGVGTVDLTYSQEVYPTLTEGYCSLSIEAAQRQIGIADLQKLPELKGDFRHTNDGIASTWQDVAAKTKTFIQVDQHAGSLYFILDVTTLTDKPAADIPYVKPITPDEPNPDNPDSDPPDSSTNASD